MSTLSFYLIIAALLVSMIGIPLCLYIDREKQQLYEDVLRLIIISTLLLLFAVISIML